MSDYGERSSWEAGCRVELHPGHDMWMRGARFGTVTSQKGDVVFVKLDLNPRKRLRVRAADLRSTQG